MNVRFIAKEAAYGAWIDAPVNGARIVLAGIAMRTELKSIEQYNQVLLLGCFALLVVVFVPGLGSSVNGARRWINLGISKFQTVEAVKVLYIVWLSSYLVRFRDEVNATWPAMLKPLGVAGALAAGTIREFTVTAEEAAPRALCADMLRTVSPGGYATAYAAFAAGDVAVLREATKDRMHQDIRFAASPNSHEAFTAALATDAWCTWLSGSGPTVGVLCAKADAARIAGQLPKSGLTHILDIDHDGAVFI